MLFLVLPRLQKESMIEASFKKSDTTHKPMEDATKAERPFNLAEAFILS